MLMIVLQGQPPNEFSNYPILIFKSIMHWKTLALLLLFSINAKAQTFDFGGTLGLSMTFGTTVNRVGFVVKGFTTFRHFQLNAQSVNFYNIKNFGIAKKGLEAQHSIGLLYGFGGLRSDSYPQPLAILSSQTGYKNHIGYAYNFYNDVHQMNQKTGTVAINLNRLLFVTENDAFSFVPHDRYRTAGAFFRYQLDAHTFIALQTTLWTGDPFYSTIQPMYDNYPSPSGYEDMTGARFAHNSHGILAAQIVRLLPYQQAVSANLGIDAEQVRHFIQNRLIHDLPFIPKKCNIRRQPHIPMVASDGQPYLFQHGQTIRPSRFWGNINLNAPYFY